LVVTPSRFGGAAKATRCAAENFEKFRKQRNTKVVISFRKVFTTVYTGLHTGAVPAMKSEATATV